MIAYRKLAQWFLEGKVSSPTIFALCFLVLTWNLMCHSCNTVNIHMNHINWSNDALTIMFGHMKNDQTGKRCKLYPHHIYANPWFPSICPIFVLGLYFLFFPTLPSSDGPLFPGGSQYSWFSGILKRLCKAKLDEIAQIGVKGDKIGLHSIRKGSATYASSGTTSSPSSAAIHNQAGWSFGSVTGLHLHYEAAGDQYIG